MVAQFHERLLEWWAVSGRHDLPWQIDRDPYRVWVSEIMLQQTQVGTVIDYFQRFMARFPSLRALAEADVDEVLALWSGLGYYARARNLHKAARQVMHDFHGELPKTTDKLLTLPGIGRSTANAIIAQAHNQRAVILDGNVKRVLARHRAITGWPGQTRIETKLWAVADEYTPSHAAADYTQAIMDLGAMVCTRTQPNCKACPVAEDCQGRLLDKLKELPTPKPKTPKKSLAMTLIIWTNESGQVWLEKRPSQGIWGGLWCFPELDVDAATKNASKPIMPPMEHLLTHRVMKLEFVSKPMALVLSHRDQTTGSWFTLHEALALGLPQPIRIALQALGDSPTLIK